MVAAAILVAAGSSQRFGRDKLTVSIGGRNALEWNLATLATVAGIVTVVVVAPEALHAAVVAAAAVVGAAPPTLVAGGATRQQSVALGLERCPHSTGVICVHDAARPLTPAAVFERVLAAAAAGAAVTAVMPLIDSIKRVDAAGLVVESLERASLVRVQTPQAFPHELLRRAHARAADAGTAAGDDCVLVERLGEPVLTVAGDERAMKLTVPADLELLEAYISAAGMSA